MFQDKRGALSFLNISLGALTVFVDYAEYSLLCLFKKIDKK